MSASSCAEPVARAAQRLDDRRLAELSAQPAGSRAQADALITPAVNDISLLQFDRFTHAIAAGRRKPSDFAIFYRVNALSRVVEQSLRRAKVPYQMVRGQEFYARKEIKDVLAY